MITLNTAGKPVEIIEKEIDVRFLEARKIELEEALSKTPVLKEEPDEDTLKLWNGMMQTSINNAVGLKKELDSINAKLKFINDLCQ